MANHLAISHTAVIDVTIVLIEESFASTSIAPLEVFHSAGRLWNALHGDTPEPRFRVRVASISGTPVTTQCALALVPECAIEDIGHTDIIMLPASGLDIQDHIARSTSLLPWLREWHRRGAYIAGICTGVAFLAESGLLDGRVATTHWAVASLLQERYPQIQWRPEQFVTEDGQMFCSGGIYASIDLSLYLVEKFCGHEIALKCAKALLLSMPRSRQSGYAMLRISLPHSDARIRELEEYLQANLERDISIESLAERISVGPRSFVRRFKSATGHAPGAYMQLLRIAAAKDLLENESTPVAQVSGRIGYSDVAFFRRLFKRHTGLTPSEYREKFGRLTFMRGALMSGLPS
ncbi:helix-turn-helix domain-containing protein [Pseudoduganella sp. FT25W]|uniref:Helix-turn-helix domain-containing protein n=1 Tax=Duganella alba TaxID=2666081 RepID=A0A6L5QQ19_9BURK|nr:helix-turn-helix domain-containing protein [Duganella alba]MRX11785.1 helix-turn-helix domain-containing protein [Duganella alba]MRX20229.1 helix-turn-helix domain-containing protein [Duganella alba]